MKKLLLLTILVLISVSGFSQELTADTPAVDSSIMQQIIELLIVGLITLIGIVIKRGLPLLDAYLKDKMHFRGADVVRESLIQAINDLETEVQKALADGKITPEEKAGLKIRAKEIAKSRLEKLSGFYKKDLLAWIDDRLSVELAKLLTLI